MSARDAKAEALATLLAAVDQQCAAWRLGRADRRACIADARRWVRAALAKAGPGESVRVGMESCAEGHARLFVWIEAQGSASAPAGATVH